MALRGITALALREYVPGNPLRATNVPVSDALLELDRGCGQVQVLPPETQHLRAGAASKAREVDTPAVRWATTLSRSVGDNVLNQSAASPVSTTVTLMSPRSLAPP